MYARALLLAALACVPARAHAAAQPATSDPTGAEWNEETIQLLNLSKPLPRLKIYLDKYERNNSNLNLTDRFNQVDNEKILNKTMSLRQNGSVYSERRLYKDIFNNSSFNLINFVHVLNVDDLRVHVKSDTIDKDSDVDGSVLRRKKEKRSANRVVTVNKDADSVTGSTVLRVEVTSVIPVVHVAERSRKMENTKNSSSGAPLLNYIFDTYSNLNTHQHRGDRSGGPSIVKAAAAPDVTSHVEATAHLDCKVAALQDKVVSWVRRKGIGDSMELLTIGTQKYAADARYSVEFVAPDTWRLQIAHVRATDAGDYECQVSAHPPVHTRSRLLVPLPELQILDENGREFQEKFCELNSTISLQCVVRNIAMTGRVVDWYHGEKHLNYDVERGGISVRTRLLEAGAESVLRVARVTPRDGGRYACGVSELRAVVTVHALKGESLAELHQGTGTSIGKTMTLQNIIQVLLYIVVISIIK